MLRIVFVVRLSTNVIHSQRQDERETPSYISQYSLQCMLSKAIQKQLKTSLKANKVCLLGILFKVRYIKITNYEELIKCSSKMGQIYNTLAWQAQSYPFPGWARYQSKCMLASLQSKDARGVRLARSATPASHCEERPENLLPV